MKKHHYILVVTTIFLFSFTIIATDYFTYKSDEGKYSIDFPAKPEESSQDVESAVGTITLKMAILDLTADEKAENALFLTNYTDYPVDQVDFENDSLLKGFYEGALNGSIKNVKGKLISQKDIVVDKFKGIEADVDFMDGQAIIRMRYLIVGNRLYMLESMTETAKMNNAQQMHFFDSFKLLK